MLSYKIYGWPEVPYPDYKQVLPFGIFILNISSLILNCQCSMVNIFTFGISKGARGEEQSLITTS